MGLVACALLVTLCYFFVDRPVAFFVHDHHRDRFAVLKWLTYRPVVLEGMATIVLVLGAARLAWGPFTRVERTLFAAAVSLAVALALKNSLKVAFGRYWPETWVENNPSLIGDGAYGFHPFHTGAAYESFPSGHTTRVCAVMDGTTLEVLRVATDGTKNACSFLYARAKRIADLMGYRRVITHTL